MLRKLGLFALMLGLTLPAWSADRPGTISGYVRDGAGTPQMGAVVEILGSQIATAFTDEHGFFSAGGLLPGIYDIKVSAASFLPSFRDGVGLRAGGKILLNLTLTTLFDAVKIAPAQSPAEQDDWKWILRSSANRSILRVVEDKSGKSTVAVGDSSKSNHDLKGTLSFVAGSASDGFGGASDMSTAFSVERSIFAADTIGLWGNIGYNNGEASPASVVRASFSHKMDNGSEPQFALTMRNLPAPFAVPNAAFQALSMTTSDSFALGDAIELHFGSELQSVQFLGHVTAFRPFGSADVHLSPNTIVEYRYATSEPDEISEKGVESARADLSESQPRVSMVGFNSALEHAHHHELSVSRHLAPKTNVQVAAFYDRIVDPALTGVGEFSTDGGMILPDIYSGTFTYQGADLKTEGMRFVLQQKLTSDITGTMDVDYGGVLAIAPGANLANAQNFMSTRYRHSVSGKLTGTMPKTKAHWIVSYRWVDGQALTPVDVFNASPGHAAPYLNLYVRQPIPLIFPGHVEALIDVRNLLAQGYVPVLGEDRRTVYLVQDARAVRGGLNFTF
ncbi:MAG: carboxypeptidase regulatory-like domain-containing protein [Acidobacteriaceae bacterium]|nr:carboxypeptidase regulatory-like domain-containing protein [Acidobacteriaceae bacterium]